MAIIDADRDELSKILLVACDQSYDPAAEASQEGNSLYGFPDSKDAQHVARNP